MARIFMKGCEAIAEAAVRAGCRLSHHPAERDPRVFCPPYAGGGRHVRAGRERGSLCQHGVRRGLCRYPLHDLLQLLRHRSEERGHQLLRQRPHPRGVLQRAAGRPRVGAIQPAQQDYNQATKASGNGGFCMMVLAPSTVQEAVDLTYKAFDYADRDRNPVLVLADGVIGTMMEPVELPEMKSDAEVAAIKDGKKKWACIGHELDYANRAWIEPGHWSTVAMQQANEDAEAMYCRWAEEDVQVEKYRMEDAEIVLTAYRGAGTGGRQAHHRPRAGRDGRDCPCCGHL